MVKLIRLKANASDNNTEINNTFKQPLIIEPNSRIALAGLDVHLRDIAPTEGFPIVAPNNTLKVDGTTLTLAPPVDVNGDPSSYTLADLEKETNAQMGLNAVSWRLNDVPKFPGGMNYQLSSNDSKFTFTKFHSPLRATKVESNYTAATGNATTAESVAGGTIVGQDDSPDVSYIVSNRIVPNGSFATSFHVNRSAAQGNNAIEWSVRPDEGWDEIIVAAGINAAGNYYTVFNGDDGDSAHVLLQGPTAIAGAFVVGKQYTILVPGTTDFTLIGAADSQAGTVFTATGVGLGDGTAAIGSASGLNERIEIIRAGTEVTVSFFETDGSTLKDTIVYALTKDMWESYWGSIHCKYLCEIPQGSRGSISYLHTTELDLDFRTGLGSSSTTLTLEFLSTILRLYFGWKTKGPFKNTADPAVLTSPGIISGENTNPGITVCVDPFILDSYDGSDTSKFQSNILYVIHDTSAFMKNVSMEISPHIALDIRNDSAMSLNQMRVLFRDVGGNPISFLGLPLVTIVIYGPDE